MRADECGLRAVARSAYARCMQRLLLLMIACLCLPGVADAQIYSWTDAQGNVVFSDQKPPPGVTSRSVELQPLPTVPAAPAAPSPAAGGLSRNNAAPAAAQARPVLQIVSPGNEQGVRANNGDVTFNLKLSPALGKGQALNLYLDGKSAYVGGSLSIQLSNLDRGAHHAYVVLIDAQGQVLRRSEAITFYVLRHSILFKKKPGGQTP
jgi:hypothetical protein